MEYIYNARIINWTAGSPTINIPLDFLQTRGRRRQRQSITKMVVRSTLNLTTIAGASLDGRDQSDFIKLFRVFDAEGDRRYVLGDEIRQKAHLDLGNRAPANPITFPAATTADATFEHVINFKIPHRSRRGYDYCMPVDDLMNGGGIELTLPVTADLRLIAGVAPTINSGTYELSVFCEEQHDLQYPVRDVVRGFAFPSQSEFYVSVSNKLVREVVAYVRGIVGNTTIVAGVAVTNEPYALAQVRWEMLKRGYLSFNDSLVVGDPIFDNKSIPLVYSGYESKIPDMKLIGGQLLYRFSAPAAYTFLTHYISPRSRAMTEQAARRWGYDDVAAVVSVANKGGSGRDPREWEDFGRFMPAKQVGKPNRSGRYNEE